MTREPLPFYKLVILYTLSKVRHPLTQSQMSDLLLGRNYMDYIHFCESISSLSENSLLREEVVRNRTFLSLTDEGRSTIGYFENRLDPEIRTRINQDLTEHELDFIDELAISTNCYRTTGGDYIAELVIREKQGEAMNLKLSFPTEEIAQSVCGRFQGKSADLYQYLLKELMQ